MILPGSLALRRTLRHPQPWLCARRAKSSTPHVQLDQGLPLLLSTLWRCAQNHRELDKWEDKELVPSTLSTAERLRLFALVNTPARLQFDTEEFLHGSKLALEQLILATKSQGFIAHVQSGGDAKNEDVALVEAFCTPRGLRYHWEQTQQALDKQMMVVAEHVEVESVQLNEAIYGQVSEHELALELQGKRTVVNEITENATLERLVLSVKATVNERLRRERIGEEVQVVDQKNVYFAVLASDVTTPEAVDWAFVANVLAHTSRSNQVSREAVPSNVEE